nr:hypothetical protein [Marinicella sp. W31]MDC2876392.1 hypothetical protein [Marinicella sp. W31]
MVYALWACLAAVIATGLIMTDAKTPIAIAKSALRSNRVTGLCL